MTHERVNEACLLQLLHSLLPLLGRRGGYTRSTFRLLLRRLFAQLLQRLAHFQFAHVMLLLELGEPLSLLSCVLLLMMLSLWTGAPSASLRMDLILLGRAGWRFLFLARLRWEMLVYYHFFLHKASVYAQIFLHEKHLMVGLLSQRAHYVEIDGCFLGFV